jgi:hypothetical protein
MLTQKLLVEKINVADLAEPSWLTPMSLHPGGKFF